MSVTIIKRSSRPWPVPQNAVKQYDESGEWVNKQQYMEDAKAFRKGLAATGIQFCLLEHLRGE